MVPKVTDGPMITVYGGEKGSRNQSRASPEQEAAMPERLGFGTDRALAERYREQAARLRIMTLFLDGADLRANLRAAARIYEGFIEKLEAPIPGTP
jgi:hypothetical protein